MHRPDNRKEHHTMTAIRCVILDVDGTLVDSNDAHAQAWVDALHEFGHDVPFDRVRRLIGMGSDNLLPEVASLEKESEQVQQISQRRGEIFKDQYLSTIKPFPGGRDLLLRMRNDGFKLVVASSAQADELEPLLTIAQAVEIIEGMTSSSDAKNSKPDPDIVQAAVAKSGTTADVCVMLGDTPYDVESAGKAGVKVIALRCGGWRDADLQGAIAMYDDPADLLAHYDESPLAQGSKERSVRESTAQSQQETSDEPLAMEDVLAEGDQPA
jgi:HAD superfamily hydrolase (TIGR01509 family)